MPRLPHCALAAALVAVPAFAQAGNEVVFVGTSTSGSTDMHAFVASGTGTIVQQAGNIYTDNVTDAVWANTGRNLYVGQSLQNRVSRAEWNGSSATWSSFYAAPGACYGLGLDTFRQLLWVLTGPGSSRDLYCLDADPSSPTYGTKLTQTSLGSASRERWALSPSGNLAAVPHVFLSSGLFQLVDTNPGSATFLQPIVTTTVPNAIALGFSFVAACAVSLDDAYAYVLYTGIPPAAYLAVWNVGASQWLDFDAAPGQQDFLITLPVPNGMALSLDRSFAVVAGQGGSGGVMRINFDYAVPANTAGTVYTGLSVPNCNGISLSPEDGRVAVTSTPASVSPPGMLVIFDASSGAVLHSVPLGNMWNIYTTAWQDGSPTATYTPYGTGCAGTLGVPALQAASGSRPALGTTFTADVLHLPFGIALVGLGLSNTMTSTSLPLPFPLDPIGMPGCMLLADPLILTLVVGAGNSATWSWALPSTPDVFGFSFFNQAFSLDPAANSFGFTASNGGAGFIGY